VNQPKQMPVIANAPTEAVSEQHKQPAQQVKLQERLLHQPQGYKKPKRGQYPPIEYAISTAGQLPLL